MAVVAFSDENTLNLLVGKYGTKSVAVHYTKKVRDALARLDLAATTQNTLAMAAEVKVALAASEQLARLLGNDNNLLGDEPESSDK